MIATLLNPMSSRGPGIHYLFAVFVERRVHREQCHLHEPRVCLIPDEHGNTLVDDFFGIDQVPGRHLADIHGPVEQQPQVAREHRPLVIHKGNAGYGQDSQIDITVDPRFTPGLVFWVVDFMVNPYPTGCNKRSDRIRESKALLGALLLQSLKPHRSEYGVMFIRD